LENPAMISNLYTNVTKDTVMVMTAENEWKISTIAKQE